jgi:hypothetical protein
VVDDAVIMSLVARVRELEAIQVELSSQLAQATTVAGIIARADAEVPRPRLGPVSHRRNRHGMHLVQGSAAAALLWLLKGTFGVVKAHKVAAALGLSAAALILAVLPAFPVRDAVYVRHELAPPPPPPVVAARHHHRHHDRDAAAGHAAAEAPNMPQHAPPAG